ncbi:PEP-CTERM sorting domain-containing protein [Oceaniferula spumae]
MKHITAMVAASAAITGSALAQSVTGTLAHWDFVDGVQGQASLAPEKNGIDCVTPKKVYPEGLGYSWSTIDSEDGTYYGANCFGYWNANDCVIFDVNFANEAVGAITEVNFDVGNYGKYTGRYSDWNINEVELRVFKNGTEISSRGQFIATFDDGTASNPWTASSDQTFDVSSLGLTSENGSSDTFRFAIFVTDDKYSSNYSRIALDNFRVNGHVDCVPEPASAALLGLAGFAMLLRRRR